MFRPSDQNKEQESILRRQQREAERKERLLKDPKKRMMGVDTDFLERQKQERREREQLEKDRDLYFDQQRMRDAQIAEQLERQREQLRREKEKQLLQFRENYQKKEYQREWDLNDPEQVQKDDIGRVHDFHGEDLGAKERLAAQHEQQRRWAEQQRRERELKEQMEKQEEIDYQRQQDEMTRLALEMEQQRQQMRAQKLQELKETNIELANIRRQREFEQMQRDEEDRVQELQNQLNSDLLNERFETTMSATNPNRFKPYNFKSLRPDQYQEIFDIRQKQLQEKEMLKQQEKQLEEAWDHQILLNNRMAMKLQREQERLRQAMRKDLADTQLRQASIHKDRLKQLEGVYAPKITEDFFSQFGTTSR